MKTLLIAIVIFVVLVAVSKRRRSGTKIKDLKGNKNIIGTTCPVCHGHGFGWCYFCNKTGLK